MSTNPSPRLPDFQIEYCYVSNFLLESNSREWELNKVSFFSCHRHGVFVKEAADIANIDYFFEKVKDIKAVHSLHLLFAIFIDLNHD